MTSPPTASLVSAVEKPVPVSGQHYWITRKRLPGVVLCKWCGLTRGPAAKARRCDPLDAPPATPLATGEAENPNQQTRLSALGARHHGGR